LGFVKDGELFVTGRIKDLIIIRGLNYYPQDIEKTVERCHPQLCALACVAFSVPVQNEERLVVVQEVERHASKADLEEAIAEIRSQVSSVHGLSTYAIVLIKSNSIPKTTSGKLQHAEARRRFLEGTLDVVCQSIADEVKPDGGSLKQQSLLSQMVRSTPEEGRQQFIEIYLRSQIARITRIQPTTIDWQQPTSALGLDSLMSVELKHQVETDLEVLLPLEELFRDWTLSQLAEAIVRLFNESPRSGPEATIELQPFQELHGTHPLSSMQQGLWFLNQLRPASNEYNLSFRIQISGFLNVSRLEQSLNEIIQRHAILRVTIVEQDGKSEMLIKPYQAFHLPVEECPFVGEDTCEEAVCRRTLAEARRPFDLVSGPLFRFLLLRMSKDEHALLLNVHHIVFDGWSLGIFLRELTALYTSHASENASALPPLITHYGEYVSWQRKWLQSKEYAEQLSYWQRQLADVPALLDLPTDHPRPSLRSFHGARHSFEISQELLERLRQFSRREQTTLFTTLLAAFQILLFRYSGQQDIIVGTPVSGRTQAAIKDLIGLFVNTLAIRTDFSTVSDFSAFLKQVKTTLVAAYAHADVPFEAIVEAIQPERDLSHTPVFQVAFAMQNIPMPALQAGKITLSPAEVANESVQCDLSLSLLETPTGLLGHVDYTTDLFELPTIQRFAQHFQMLLQGIVGCPQERISDFPLLTQSEREQLLIQWNATQVAYPQNQCLHQLFEAQAQRTPEAIALVFEQQQLSYGELNARANQLAHYLQRVGVGPEVLVGVCVERSLEMVIGLLAILKAGGAYVPLDPTYPQERLAFMLEDAQVFILLTFQGLREKFTQTDRTILCLDSDWLKIEQSCNTNPGSSAQTDNLAYAIYTSGSTGQPKSVQVTHKGINNVVEAHNLVIAQNAIYSELNAEHVLQYASLSFDVSLFEIAMALLNGAKLVLIEHVKRVGMELYQQLREKAISMVALTPTVLSTLPIAELPTLQTAIIGGEVCPSELIERWAVGRHFFNAYGPTETTVCASIAPYQKSQLKLNIGRPISNVHMYILDQRMQPVAIGVIGELYIGGVGLARGYGRRAELTAERFVPDPFSGEVGGRLYRTGDLARYLPDSNLEFVGRVDQQVKIRGFRIELGEIESVLQGLGEVRAAVVLVCEDQPGHKTLVAYVVPAGPTVDPGALRRQLRTQIPDYMVPSSFVLLDALPLTPNGKLDHRALPAPEEQRAYRFVAPRTPIEEILADIWSDILGVSNISIYDNFLELGGHSLLATRATSQIRQILQVEISLQSFFEAQCLAELASLITRNKPTQENLMIFEEILDEIESLSEKDLETHLRAIQSHTEGGN
jgi:amino acid adenylation domain-containing protein